MNQAVASSDVAHSRRRAFAEILGLTVIAGIVMNFFISPETEGLNLDPLSLKWIVYVWALGSTIYIFAALVPVMLVGAVIQRVREKGYWPAYRTAFYITLIWAGLMMLGSWKANQMHTEANTSIGPESSASSDLPAQERPAPAGLSEIQAFTSIQSSQGFSTDNLNQETLGELEAYTVDLFQRKADQRAKLTNSASLARPSSEAHYILADGQKLALIRLSWSAANGVVVYGFKSDEFYSIRCIWMRNEPLPISYGPCAEEISRALDVSIGP